MPWSSPATDHTVPAAASTHATQGWCLGLTQEQQGMQESRAFLFAHGDGCARSFSLEVAWSRAGTSPHSDFRQRSAQERLVSHDLRQGQGHTGFTANSLNTPHLQRETPDPSVTVCRKGKAQQYTTTMFCCCLVLWGQ